MTAAAAEPIHPRQVLKPGWYWAFIDVRDTPMSVYQAWQKNNAPHVFTTRTQQDESSGVIFKTESPLWWILFEVRDETVTWTLPGFPTPTSLGANETLSHVMGGDAHRVPAITSPEHPWNEFWGNSESNPLSQVKGTAENALKVLLYGGAGILLLQLLLASRGNPIGSAVKALKSGASDAASAVRKRLPRGGS